MRELLCAATAIGYDTVQSFDTIQVRSDLDFGVRSVTVQVYSNNYKS